LVLDEFFTNLDAIARRDLRGRIARLAAEGVAVLIAARDPAVLERLAARAAARLHADRSRDRGAAERANGRIGLSDVPGPPVGSPGVAGAGEIAGGDRAGNPRQPLVRFAANGGASRGFALQYADAAHRAAAAARPAARHAVHLRTHGLELRAHRQLSDILVRGPAAPLVGARRLRRLPHHEPHRRR